MNSVWCTGGFTGNTISETMFYINYWFNSITVIMVVFPFNTVIYVFLFLCLCILIVCLCIFIVPAGTLRLPWLRFFRAFSSVVRQMPGYNWQRWGHGPHSSQTFCVVLRIFCFVSFCLLCVCVCVCVCSCKCVLQYYHRVATQLQLHNV